MNNILKYNQPAGGFIEALPIGNGYIGACVYGGTDTERYSLNECTLWSGHPSCDIENGNPRVLAEVKRLMSEEKHKQAQDLLEKEFSGFDTQYFLPLGNIIIENDAAEHTEYLRHLDLSRALHKVEFGGKDYTVFRESFVSHPHRVMAVKIRQKGINATRISFNSQLQHLQSTKGSQRAREMELIIRGVAPKVPQPVEEWERTNPIYSENDAEKGMKYTAVVHIETDGKLSSFNNTVVVAEAEEIIIYFAARTSFKDYKTHPYLEPQDCEALCFHDIEKAVAAGYEGIKESHIADHSALFGRTEFSITTPTKEYTDKLLQGGEDPARFELLWNMGKYLTIAGSRKGGQAMNLQGLWNEKLMAPWRSNYTININTEMNYLPTMRLNLPECFEPYVDLVKELSDNGSKVAKAWFGIDGIIVNHNTDLWRLANPVSYKRSGITQHSYFPFTYGWMLWGLYDKFLIDRDMEFLKDTLYPLIIKSAKTFLPMLEKDENGKLYAFLATSPENLFYLPDGSRCALAHHSAIGNAIVRDVFAMAAETSEILGYSDNAELYKSIKEQMLPYLVGCDGRILEWDREWPECDLRHRHVSHLYGLHPTREITPDGTPDLAEACKNSLNTRGDSGTGWCIAWKANMWARLRDGDRALKLLENQLNPSDCLVVNCSKGGTYPNMFCAHPPFQIDGNFGATAAIIEMLVQCIGNKVYLLPALPTAWKEGYIKGIRINGGATINLSWGNGKVKDFEILPAEKQKEYEIIF